MSWQEELQKPVDRNALKDMPHMPGFQSIEVYYVVNRLNDVFGPCGEGWGVRGTGDDGEFVFQFHKETKEVSTKGKFWFSSEGKGIQVIRGVGGCRMGRSMVYAMQGAISNLISKCASYLGVGMEIYSGGSVDTHMIYHQNGQSTPPPQEDDSWIDGAGSGEEVVEPPVERTGGNYPRQDNPLICPKCGGKLRERTVRKGPRAGTRFYGCANWKPNDEGCDYTQEFK